MRVLRVVFVVMLLPVVGACHMFHHKGRADECQGRSPYVRAQSVPVLHAAEGLPPPNTHNSLKVPDDVAAGKPHQPGSSCLDSPPNFYTDRPKPASAK